MERIRCFIAVDIEEPTITANVRRIMQALSFFGNRIKLVKLENIHLTLRFLGEIPKSLVDEVAEALDTINYTPFTITLKDIGAFPNFSRPRVIWIGVEEGVKNLKKLADQVNFTLKKLRFPPPDKPFSPHVTIARVKRPIEANKLLQIMDTYRGLYGSMQVNKIRLKKSTLTPHGPIYTTLHEKILSGQ